MNKKPFKSLMFIVIGLFGSFLIPEKSFATAGATDPACAAAVSAAKGWCEGVDIVASVSQLIPQVATGLSDGDMEKLCEKSKKLNQLGVAANASFGTLCWTKANSCSAACEREIDDGQKSVKTLKGSLDELDQINDSNASTTLSKFQCAIIQDNISSAKEGCVNKLTRQLGDAKEELNKLQSNLGICDGFKANATKAGLQAAQNLLAMGTSQACLKQVAGVKCETIEDLRTKPQCKFQLCGPGGRFANTTECQGFVDIDCSNPDNFGQPVCICRQNPQDPICPGVVAGGPNDPNNPNFPGGGGGGGGGPRFGGDRDGDGIPDGTGGSPFAPGFTDADLQGLLTDNDPTNDDFARNELANRGAGGAGAGGGQPGSPLQTSQFNPGGGPGGRGGQGRGPFNTDILGAADRDKGTFPSGGGGGAYPFGGGGDDKKQAVDLKDFLPGGKGARAIASQKELEKNGISEANGLTNFQKVTRKINDMRAKDQVLKEGP